MKWTTKLIRISHDNVWADAVVRPYKNNVRSTPVVQTLMRKPRELVCQGIR